MAFVTRYESPSTAVDVSPPATASAFAADAVSPRVDPQVVTAERVPVFARSLVDLEVFPVSDGVESVATLGIPAEVLQPVVAGDVVVVARFHAGRARADERFENQPVDGAVILAFEDDMLMPTGHGAGLQDLAANGAVNSIALHDHSIQGSHLPSVADLVSSLMSYHWKPHDEMVAQMRAA